MAILVGTVVFFLVILIVFHEVLVPFIVAVVLAYVLYPVVAWLHRRSIRGRTIPRWVAVILIYVVLFGVLGIFGTTVVPRLAAETSALVGAVPGYIAQLRDDFVPSIEGWVDERLAPLFPNVGPEPDEDSPDSGAADAAPAEDAAAADTSAPTVEEVQQPVEGGDSSPATDGGGSIERDGAPSADSDAYPPPEAGPLEVVESLGPIQPLAHPEQPEPPAAETSPEPAEEEADTGIPRDLLGGAPTSTAVTIRPLPDGGFSVELPEAGLTVERIDEGRYRIGAPQRPRPQTVLDLRRQLDEILERMLEQGEQHAVSALRFTQRAVFVTVEFVFSAILALMLAAFILATTPAIMAFFRSLFPPRIRDDFDQLVGRIDRGLGGVIRGQLMICLINGILSGIGFAIAGLRYWPVWTLLATVASIVPIFGTIVSSVPAIAIGLTQGWGTGLFVFIWIVAIHELEANVFNPKIMGDSAKMHPVIVVFALLAGAHAGGVLGALLGVPVASILQSLFRFLRSRAYGEDERWSVVPPPDCPDKEPLTEIVDMRDMDLPDDASDDESVPD